MSISEQLEKEKKIKQEINRLKKLYKEFDKDKAKALEGLINNAAFMKVGMELQNYLNRENNVLKEKDQNIKYIQLSFNVIHKL